MSTRKKSKSRPIQNRPVSQFYAMISLFGACFSVMIVLMVVQIIIFRHELSEMRQEVAMIRELQSHRTPVFTELTNRLKVMDDTLDRRTPMMNDMAANLSVIEGHITKIETRLGIGSAIDALKATPATQPTTRPSK